MAALFTVQLEPSVTAPVQLLNVPLLPERSNDVEPEEVAPLMTGEVRVLFVSVCAFPMKSKVSETFAMSGIVSVAAPVVWAARLIVTVCAAASTGRSFKPPEVLPLMRTKPVLVLPVARVSEGVVASLIVTAPDRVLAPVDVMKVAVLPTNVMEPAPEAVRPPAITGVVSVHEVVVEAPVNVLPASVRATVKAASGRAMERAALGPVKVICWPKIGSVLEAFGSVTTVAVPAIAVGTIVASPEVTPNIFTLPAREVFVPSVMMLAP